MRIIEAPTPPGLRFASGGDFHASLIRVVAPKPFVMTNLVFEGPGDVALEDDLVGVEINVSRGALFIGDLDTDVGLQDGTAPGESRLIFRKTASEMARYLKDVRYAWDDEYCNSLEELNFTFEAGEHIKWNLSAFLQLPACQGFALNWTTGVVRMGEGSSVSLDGISITSDDADLFVVVEIKNPPGVAGDCQVVVWPGDVLEFQPGRECTLDGTVEGLARVLPKIVYTPPPEFSGELRLQVSARRAEVAVEAIHGGEGGSIDGPPTAEMTVLLNVSAVNNVPEIRVDQEFYSVAEDAMEHLVLSPFFVTDVDAGDWFLTFRFEIMAAGSVAGELYMCGLLGVTVEEPARYTGDCLPPGIRAFSFSTSTSQFNALQLGAGRLRFRPAPDWSGALLINATVDDLGGAGGLNVSQTAWRSVHIAVEPSVDAPFLTFRCADALPLKSYGRAGLEVRNCLELSLGADAGDEGSTMWLSITSSDPGVAISTEDSAPVSIRREGTASIEIFGLSVHVREMVKALRFRPPPYLFASPEAADMLNVEVAVTARSLGQLFGGFFPEDLSAYPGDSVSFSVAFLRLNRAPLIFTAASHFSASQLEAEVAMPGISVADGDMLADDVVEVSFEVASSFGGGALVFNETEGVSITKQMPLHALNDALRDLRFIFQDSSWFGVTSMTMRVSDLGNRGCTVPGYEEKFHRDTLPQVLALRGAALSFTPLDSLQYHALFSGDFTWEVYVKRLPNGSGVAEDVAFQNFGLPPSREVVFRFVGTGWCVNDMSDRIKIGASWKTTSIRVDQGADSCEAECAADSLCVGYMTQDSTKCDTIRSTDSNAAGGIQQSAQNVIGADDGLTYCWGKQKSRAGSRLSISPEGRPLVAMHHEVPGGVAGPLGGLGRSTLVAGTWYHLAVVFRRTSSRLSGFAVRAVDTTRGEVALFVDGALDTAWPMEVPHGHFGPERRTWPSEGGISGPMPSRSSEFAAVDGSAGLGGGLLLSRLRLWDWPLDAGDLGLCDDMGLAASAAPSSLGNPVPRAASAEERGRPIFSFDFDGSLAEASERAIVRPTGTWSFDVDAPPRCTGATERPYDGVFEHYIQYDHGLAADGEWPYMWYSPQAYAGRLPGVPSSVVKAESARSLHATAFLAIYRNFVNEPPALRILEPRDGVLYTTEDIATHFSLAVSHKAEEQQVSRPIAVSLGVSHGYLRTLSNAAAARLALGLPHYELRAMRHTDAARLALGHRRTIEYRGPLTDVNDFLAQIEYVPDPNYGGPDLVEISVTDMELSFNTTMQVVVTEKIDPLTLVCPPAVDMMEGCQSVLIGSNVSVHDGETLPGFDDRATDVMVEIVVGGGQVYIDASNLESSPNLTALAMDTNAGDDIESLAQIVFNCTMSELRYALHHLRYTPVPPRFHGVVHFGLRVIARATGAEASCDVGLSVLPVNTAPEISVDAARLLMATGGTGAVRPYEDTALGGVLRLYDPDEEEFSEWFSQRTHTARLKLSASCGSLSLGMARASDDYVLGVQNGSIASLEGLTFHAGDGLRDASFEVTSTLDNLNGHLHRLYHHSQHCRETTVRIDAHIDDLGNYGAGGALTANASFTFDVALY